MRLSRVTKEKTVESGKVIRCGMVKRCGRPPTERNDGAGRINIGRAMWRGRGRTKLLGGPSSRYVRFVVRTN